MSMRRRSIYYTFIILNLFFILATSHINININEKIDINGKIIELDESNFEEAISTFDFIFVDFYAPWCSHCKRLNPQLEAAAPVLAQLREPIVIAKVDADKYRSLADKYEIGGFPTLMLFTHGVPMDYHGPRDADLLVRYLKKFVAPNVAVLDSDVAISNFVDEASTYFPSYIGFGMNESVISNLAIKHKKRAWFSVAKDFSGSVMESYDFDKVPALVSLHPAYDERNIFYGPFDDQFLEEFIKQNLLPLCLPLNSGTLKLLKDEERKIVLTVVKDENDEKSKQVFKLLKAAASANRDYLFAYVGLKQFEDFVEAFEINKKTTLPKMVVWDGNEEYFTVIGSESIGEDSPGSDITHFLEGYREGKTVSKKTSGPSFIQFLSSLIGYKLIFIIIFVVVVIVLILTLGNTDEDDERPHLRPHNNEVRKPSDKED